MVFDKYNTIYVACKLSCYPNLINSVLKMLKIKFLVDVFYAVFSNHVVGLQNFGIEYLNFDCVNYI